MIAPALVSVPAEVEAALWRSALRGRWRLGLALALLLALIAACASIAEVSAGNLIQSLPALGQYARNLVPATNLRDWFWGLPKWMNLLWDTVLIAAWGTTTGAMAGLLLSFFASRNLVSSPVIREGVRRLLDCLRTVPELVFALLFVYAFGLGPLAGILALALHSAGALGKLFSELHENVGSDQLDGVRSTGANWLQTIRYGMLPPVLPGILSYALLRFEINVRASSVLGFVGVGGIGQELHTAVRQFLYQDVSAILVLVTGAVLGINTICDWARRRLTAEKTPAGWQSGLRLSFALTAVIALIVHSIQRLQLSLADLIEGAGKLGWMITLMFPPDDHGQWVSFTRALGETLAIAFLGTLIAAAAAAPLSLTIARGCFFPPLLQAPLRRLVDAIRGIDGLIWALIFVSALGLGPFAGTLALACADTFILAKLFAEAIEDAQPGPSEALRSVGGNRWQVARFGVLPQILPVLTSHFLYFFESNTRSASILGIVGGGGIGLVLTDRIRVNEWQQVCFIVLLLLLSVLAVDLLSTRLRSFLIEGRWGRERNPHEAALAGAIP